MGGWWSLPRPGRFTPGKETRYPLYRRLGGSTWAGLNRCGKSRPPPWFDHRTVQPVANRYTDLAIPAPNNAQIYILLLFSSFSSSSYFCFFFSSSFFSFFLLPLLFLLLVLLHLLLPLLLHLLLLLLFLFLPVPLLPSLAQEPAVGYGLSNNILPSLSTHRQLSPSSHSQHFKISFYFLYPSFPGSSPWPRTLPVLEWSIYITQTMLTYLQEEISSNYKDADRYLYTCSVLNINTGLFKMIVGVLTTCHTQYTWDSSICVFLFNRTTLPVFVTYRTGALYVHPLWFYRVIQNDCRGFNNLSYKIHFR